MRDPDAVQRSNLMERANLPEVELGAIINDPNISFDTAHLNLFVKLLRS